MLGILSTSTTAFEIWFPHVAVEAGISDSDGPMALLNFGAQGSIPRFTSLTGFYPPALMLAYWYREHVFGAVFFYVLLHIFYLLTFVIFAIATDTDSTVWNFPFMNHEPLLTNRGAIGVDFVSLGYWAVVLMGAVDGEVASWAKLKPVDSETEGQSTTSPYWRQSWKGDSLFNYVKISCARCFCVCCATDKEGDGPTVVNSFTGNAPGAQVMWAAFFQQYLMFTLIALVTGPVADVFDHGTWYWLAVGATLVAFALIFAFYQNYTYGDYVAMSEADVLVKAQVATVAELNDEWKAYLESQQAAIYNRFYNKLEALYVPFIHIFLYMCGMAIFYTIMDTQDAFRRINFAGGVTEARRIARENLLLELFCIFIIWVTLTIVSTITWILVVRFSVRIEKRNE